ncbi:type I DNA topoisomerase [Candidatus Margulisiibacteriota bacterium]
MAKKLVIVESPAKARTLEKFLGKDFKVEACGGHVRDLPKKSLGVKIAQDFEPNYKIIKGKEKIIKNLKAAAQKAELVFLAPDPDREGEAIAWHLKALLEGNGKVKRIEFHEITKEAVTGAVKDPREIDMARVNAQQARRILDRIVGYKISPLLWKKVRKGLSAGRVQSVAVRLICEREAEIKKFKPEEYWDILAKLATGKNEELTAKLIARGEEGLGVRPKEKGKVISSEKEAQKILKDLEGASYTVGEIRKKEQKRHPAPPFITSTLQQEASRKLGFSAKRTMVIAQKLYEGVDLNGEGRTGLITYMRTDSVRIAQEAENAVRKYIADVFGKEYLPAQPQRYKKKKQAQDAHEAIRPTSALRHPEKVKDSLKPDELKLYDLIWKRFTACQMNSALFDQTSVDIMAKEYKFRASGSVLKFDGFIRVYLEGEDVEEEKAGTLPLLHDAEVLKLLSLTPEQHSTQPPPRYNEASLVKELEKRGIGRPSTYAPIMSTIQDRGYVEKEGKALKPTEIGGVVNGLLVKHFPRILNIKFTAHMEDDLDNIVAQKMDWIEALNEFYEPFAKALAEAEVKMEKVKKEIMTKEKCPTCGKPLVIRQGRYGDFMACSGYPKCKFTKTLPGEEEKEMVDEKCDKCGKPMVMKHSRFGSFLACSGYPQCKNTKTILKKIGAKCEKCGGELVERRTRRGKIFYGCINYPKCDFATWQRPGTEKPGKDNPNKEGAAGA